MQRSKTMSCTAFLQTFPGDVWSTSILIQWKLSLKSGCSATIFFKAVAFPKRWEGKLLWSSGASVESTWGVYIIAHGCGCHGSCNEPGCIHIRKRFCWLFGPCWNLNLQSYRACVGGLHWRWHKLLCLWVALAYPETWLWQMHPTSDCPSAEIATQLSGGVLARKCKIRFLAELEIYGSETLFCTESVLCPSPLEA